MALGGWEASGQRRAVALKLPIPLVLEPDRSTSRYERTSPTPAAGIGVGDVDKFQYSSGRVSSSEATALLVASRLLTLRGEH